MKYRPHRRLLAESMAEVIEVADRAALIEHLAKKLKPWGYTLKDDDVKVSAYGGIDRRTRWDTYVVTIRNKQYQDRADGAWYFGKSMGSDYFGAVGFTDQAV